MFGDIHTAWQDRVQAEAAALATGASPAPGAPGDAALEYLLDQTAAVDDIAHGSLSSVLLDLHECGSWRAATPAAVAERRAAALAAADDALFRAKARFLPALAFTLGVGDRYREAVLAGRGASRRAGAGSLGGAELALAAIFVDCGRDLEFAAGDDSAVHTALARAHADAVATVARCVRGSAQFWAAALDAERAARAPAGPSIAGRAPGSGWGHASAPSTPHAGGRGGSGGASGASAAAAGVLPEAAAPLGGDDVVTLYDRTVARVVQRLGAVSATVDGGPAALAAVLRDASPPPSPPPPQTPDAAPTLEAALARLGGTAALDKGRTFARRA
jgi:hypothetical protein